MAGVRIDRWLWAARMFKHRTGATRACAGGHVSINDTKVKPAKNVAIGDMVTAQTPGGLRVLEVVALAERRGPASQAQALYIDHTPPPEPTTDPWERVLRDRGAGRPTKRDARRLRKLKEG